MKPRPLHISNESNHDELSVAMNRFRSGISKCISVLVTKHGYSRARATALVLDQIRQSEESPCEDEVFQVMQHLGLGIEPATQIIIVSKSLKKVQDDRGYTKAQAIDYLSSCLTTMKLLGSLEKTAAVSDSALGSTSQPVELPSPSVPSHSESDGIENISNTSHNNVSAHTEQCNSTLARPKAATKRTSSKTNLKAVKSRLSKPPKPQKKWSKDEDTTNTNGTNPDQEVVEKALLVKEHEVQARASVVGHCKTPSPNVSRHTGKRSSSSTREHDLEVPAQPAKRQRLDSI